MEASDFHEAEYWYHKVAEQSGSIVDIYHKNIQPMTREEIESFFERPLEDLVDPEDIVL